MFACWKKVVENPESGKQMNTEPINITVLYFAKLGEDLGCSCEQLQLRTNNTLHHLLETLATRGDVWEQLSAPEIRCAVNQNICKENLNLCDGDEIAFFPPVTGG